MMVERARRRPQSADYLRGRALELAEHSVSIADLERALDLMLMGPDRYFRHERAVAAILEAVDAPVKARLVQLQREPDLTEKAG